MGTRFRIAAWCVILALSCSGAFAAPGAPVAQRLDTLRVHIDTLHDADALSQHDRSASAQRKYDELFGELTVRAAAGRSADELHLLFEAAASASFENPEGSAYRDALAALRALGEHASDREIRIAQGLLFQARRFPELHTLGDEYRGRELLPVPSVDVPVEVGDHALLAVHGESLVVEIVTIDAGPMVVVVAHPRCHFTQDAVREIEDDAEVRAAMSGHSIWVAPPDRNMDLADLVRWRQEHSDASIAIAYKYSGWPELAEWGTPTFYFFKDGALVDTVAGWPSGGRMVALKAGLARIGVLRSASDVRIAKAPVAAQ